MVLPVKRVRAVLSRWIRFSAVGALGFAVQLTVLTGLVISGLHYLTATALSVEAAVLHNFAWHQSWTWRDRTGNGWRTGLGRLARFNMTVGIISILQNLVFMRLLVGQFQVPFIAANVTSVSLCTLANFMVTDRLVFRASQGNRAPAREAH